MSDPDRPPRRHLLSRLTRRLRQLRILEEAAVQILYCSVKVMSALPTRWVMRVGDAVGTALTVLDRRGRRVAHQNLDIAFGDGMSRDEKARVFRRSYQNLMRAVLFLLHMQPMTREKFHRWVEVQHVRDDPRVIKIKEKGAVLASGHLGNFELLLGVRLLFPDFPPAVFLAEEIPHHALNRVLRKLRSHGDLLAAFRKGGARSVIKVVADGGVAGLMVDRNVRRRFGGVFAPFLGLRARTTPLPAWLALRYGVPLHPVFLLPWEGGRYKVWLGPDLAEDLPAGDEKAQTVEILTRLNAVMEQLIRAEPELWNWTLKRFKSRPEVELGGYPPYSIYDPDRPGE